MVNELALLDEALGVLDSKIVIADAVAGSDSFTCLLVSKHYCICADVDSRENDSGCNANFGVSENLDDVVGWVVHERNS